MIPPGFTAGTNPWFRSGTWPTGCWPHFRGLQQLSRIDLALETSDSLNIVDFKTSRSRWSAEQVAESSGQLLLYSQLAGDLASKPVKLSFVVLTKTKTPDVSVHEVAFDARLLDRTLNIIEHVWKSISAGNVYPVPSMMNCPSCPYRKRCAAWTG